MRAALVAGALLLLALLAVAPLALSGGRIVRGVHVGGVDVGGLTLEEGAARLSAGLAEAGDRTHVTIVDSARNISWTHPATELGVFGDPVASALEAQAVGRRGLLGRLIAPWPDHRR